MIINDVIHLVSSPLIVHQKGGTDLYDTLNGCGDIPPDIAMLETKSIRSISFPNYSVIVIDV